MNVACYDVVKPRGRPLGFIRCNPEFGLSEHHVINPVFTPQVKLSAIRQVVEHKNPIWRSMAMVVMSDRYLRSAWHLFGGTHFALISIENL